MFVHGRKLASVYQIWPRVNFIQHFRFLGAFLPMDARNRGRAPIALVDSAAVSDPQGQPSVREMAARLEGMKAQQLPRPAQNREWCRQPIARFTPMSEWKEVRTAEGRHSLSSFSRRHDCLRCIWCCFQGSPTTSTSVRMRHVGITRAHSRLRRHQRRCIRAQIRCLVGGGS